IIIIIAVIILISAIAIFVTINDNSDKTLNLTKVEMQQDTNIVNKLMLSINSNNYQEYKELVAGNIQGEDQYTRLKDDFNNNLGVYKEAILTKAYDINGVKTLVYQCKFSKNENIELNIEMNNNGQITGVYYH
ncbi:MAG: hypothetical protein ACRCX8_17225, partial [Sarcina sp.]